ncbi:MAG: iron ABC transporter permease [Syntrophobacter sp.]
MAAHHPGSAGDSDPELPTFSDGPRRAALVAILAALLLTAAFAMTRGAFDIDMGAVYRTVKSHIWAPAATGQVSALHDTIVWKLRLPRILLAMSVGMALAASGAVFQGCFRNPLVEPYILGVSYAAAFGAALAIAFPLYVLSVRMSAFLFGIAAVASACGLGRVRGRTPVVALVLAGVIIGSLFMAMVSILKYVASDAALREIVFWLMGGFYYAAWSDVYIVTPVVLVCIFLEWHLGWKLNVVSMGSEEARAMGVHPEKYRAILIALATLSTTISVSSVGVIAWVGLMAPHATRMIIGSDNRFVIPAAAMVGGIYLLVCDTVARTLVSAEIPIGIITAILGAPYLIYLLRAKGASLAE